MKLEEKKGGGPYTALAEGSGEKVVTKLHKLHQSRGGGSSLFFTEKRKRDFELNRGGDLNLNS